MNEANIDVVLDPEVTKEGEATAQRSAIDSSEESAGVLPARRPIAAAEERLPATRLPPIAPPPMRPPSVPPGALPPSVIVSSRNTPTLPPQSAPAPLEATTKYLPETGAKPSWFRALLSTTSPPPATVEVDPYGVRRSVAVGCVVAACAFAAIALVFAFRPPPSLGTMQPVVAATVVIAHALQALGAGALSYGLLRIAERMSSPRVDHVAGAAGHDGM
jgi:hypothetical protein